MQVEEDPDASARDNFVRECAVAFSVNDDKLLPIGVLEKYCREAQPEPGPGKDWASAGLHCRKEILETVREAHERGRGMQTACLATWEYFLRKYGMHCPKQCYKLQCRSTCEWLKRRRTLAKEYEELSYQRENLASAEAALGQLRDGPLLTGKLEVKRLQAASTRAETEASLAVKTQEERLEGLAEVEEKLAGAQKKVASLEDAFEARRGDVRQYEAGLRERRFALAEARQTVRTLKERAKMRRGRLQKAQAKLPFDGYSIAAQQRVADAQSQLAQVEAELAEAKKEVAKEKQEARDMREQLEAAQKVFQKVERTLEFSQEAEKERLAALEAAREGARRGRTSLDLAKMGAAQALKALEEGNWTLSQTRRTEEKMQEDVAQVGEDLGPRLKASAAAIRALDRRMPAAVRWHRLGGEAAK